MGTSRSGRDFTTLWRVSTGGCASVQSAKVRHRSRFHHQKWAWPGLSRTEPYSSCSTPPLGYWDPERVPGTSGKLERHTPSVDWSSESALPCGRGIITNTEPARYFWTKRRKLRLLKKMLSKSLPSFLDILRCCSLFFVHVLLFHWIYQRATQCRAAMRSRCLRGCSSYRRPA